MKPEISLRIWPREVEGEHQPTLELFPLDTDLAADTVLVLPGGGYGYTSPREADRVAYAFNQQGFQAAVLYYRVAPRRYPEPQQDALRAIRLLRAHAAEWRLGSRLAVCGFSAGGHLAACCGTIRKEIDADAGDDADRMETRPDALILGYPVISLTAFGHPGSSRNLTGQESETELWRRLDLQNRVTAETPPSFLWHTATDQSVSRRNSLAFAEALWQAGVPAELHVFSRGPHGLSLAARYPEAAKWVELAGNFLRQVCGFETARVISTEK